MITEDGAFIVFSNLCEVECAGYGPDQITDCDGVGDDDGPVDTEPVFHTINPFDLDGFSGNETPDLHQ